jgi:1,4-alpha-glucan branching enzyme
VPRVRIVRAVRSVPIVWVAALLLGSCAPPGVTRSPEQGPDGVVFRYRAPAARVVQLAGSWPESSWLQGREWTRDTRVGRMQDDDADGVWELRVQLPPGRYEYAFLIDGAFWEADPANPERVADGSGGTRSLLIVR